MEYTFDRKQADALGWAQSVDAASADAGDVEGGYSMMARLAAYLSKYGYTASRPLRLFDPSPTCPKDTACRVGAVIMAIGFAAEESAREIAWAVKEGRNDEAEQMRTELKAVTGIDLMGVAGKPVRDLTPDEITLLAERVMDEARRWAVSRLGDALAVADHVARRGGRDGGALEASARAC